MLFHSQESRHFPSNSYQSSIENNRKFMDSPEGKYAKGMMQLSMASKSGLSIRIYVAYHFA